MPLVANKNNASPNRACICQAHQSAFPHPNAKKAALVDHTFQALGATKRTSSRQKIAWEKRFCDKYKSASSTQASMSVGEDSKSSIRASTAPLVRDKVRRSVIRRFATGYESSYLALNSERFAIKDIRTVFTGSSSRISLYSFKTLSNAVSSWATAS